MQQLSILTTAITCYVECAKINVTISTLEIKFTFVCK